MHVLSSRNEWTWLTPYGLALLGIQFAGPFLSTRPPLQDLLLEPSGVPASALVELLTTLVSLSLIFVMASRVLPQDAEDRPSHRWMPAMLRALAAILLCGLLGYHLDDLINAPEQAGTDRFGPWIQAGGLLTVGLGLGYFWFRHRQDGDARPASLATPTCNTAMQKRTSLGETKLGDVGDSRVAAKLSCDVASEEFREGARQGPGELDRIPVTAQERAGRSIGRYQIVCRLSEDTGAQVYVAKDPAIPRLATLTVQAFESGERREAGWPQQAACSRQAEAVGRLSHPNIETLYEVGCEGAQSFVATEYLTGTTLAQARKAGKIFPLSQAVNLVITLADALDYAHRRGVVHGAITPAHILLTNDHRIKITHFARVTPSHHAGTAGLERSDRSDTLVPAKITGHRDDSQTDIVALAEILYELLAGHRASAVDETDGPLTQLRTTNSHTATFPSRRTFRPDVPPGLVKVIDRALEPSVAQRFARAGDFGHALRVALQTVAV